MAKCEPQFYCTVAVRCCDDDDDDVVVVTLAQLRYFPLSRRSWNGGREGGDRIREWFCPMIP